VRKAGVLKIQVPSDKKLVITKATYGVLPGVDIKEKVGKFARHLKKPIGG